MEGGLYRRIAWQRGQGLNQIREISAVIMLGDGVVFVEVFWEG
jgi:hypothetical protein